MADNENGTTSEATEAQEPATATGTQPDELVTLRSRNAGLDAKVTSLSQKAAAEKARADAAEARALALADAKENGDAELRAELERIKAESAKTREEAKLARIEAKYPETFSVLGQSAASLADDQLAAAEARFAGVAAGAGAPARPIGNNPSRVGSTSGPQTAKERLADMEAKIRATPIPWATD